MLARYGYLANKWLVLGMVLTAILGAALLVTLLPAGAQQADDAIEFAEIPAGVEAPDLEVANFTAVDPEGRPVTWGALDGSSALGGTDAADFVFNNGVLSFMNPPNYENPTDRTRADDPADAETNNTYIVTLTANDGVNDMPPEIVMVKVTNVEEPATTGIELSLVQPLEGEPITVEYVDSEGNPFVNSAGDDITAIVDPDGDKDDGTLPITDTTIEPADEVTWQWSRGTSRGGNFTDITEEENGTRDQVTYHPTDADRTYYLRVTATYQDGEGKGKTLEATSLFRTAPLRSDTVAPAFPPDFDRSTPNIVDAAPTAKIADGTTEGSNVGSPIPAIAETSKGERLTYSLEHNASGVTGALSHADLFQIDRATGQVTVAPGKTVNPATDRNGNVDGPKADTFTVTIRINDGSPAHTGDDNNPVSHEVTVDMTITVDPQIDEDPVFTKGKTSHEYAENKKQTDGTTDDLTVYTFAAYDPEDAQVALTLTGPDAGKFSLPEATANADTPATNTWDSILSFAAAPDYENPGDADKNNIYEVTVTATATSATDADGDTNTAPEEKTAVINVTVEVTNQQDPGSLSLSARQPRIGVPISAINLSDLDSSVSNVAYQWQITTTQPADCATGTLDALTDPAWKDAKGDGAATDTYTPERVDDGRCLRARATYTDPQGSGSANAVANELVQKARNLAPSFGDDVGPRYVLENVAVTTGLVLDPDGTTASTETPSEDLVTADDSLDAEPDNLDGPIDYNLSGADAKYFTIDSEGDTITDADGNAVTAVPGQIRVSAAGANMLDYETRRSYRVTVTATDREGLNSSTSVMINIVNVDEAPDIKVGRLAVSGPPLVPYSSMGTGDVTTYTAVGVDAAGATWDLSGDDAGDFNIDADGVLTFNTPPDFANPTDANGDNVYMVTVEVTSGTEMDTKDVTITVGMATTVGERTDIGDYTTRERFDLNSDGIVSDDEVRQALRIWAQDNPGN